MVEPAEVTVDTDVVGNGPLHLHLDALRSRFTDIDRFGLLKGIAGSVFNRYNRVALQTFIRCIEVGGVQSERAIEQIRLHTDLDVLILLSIVGRT